MDGLTLGGAGRREERFDVEFPHCILDFVDAYRTRTKFERLLNCRRSAFALVPDGRGGRLRQQDSTCSGGFRTVSPSEHRRSFGASRSTPSWWEGIRPPRARGRSAGTTVRPGARRRRRIGPTQTRRSSAPREDAARVGGKGRARSLMWTRPRRRRQPDAVDRRLELVVPSSVRRPRHSERYRPPSGP